MHSRTLKATGHGSKSFENDRAIALSPRLQLDFDCPTAHHFSVAFSAEAQLPTSWECPTCWAPAARSDGVRVEVAPMKPIRTHGDLLRERRSVGELEQILSERLALLRSGAIGPNAYEVTAKAGQIKAA